MAIDYGTRRIGIAITDPLKIFASPLETVSNTDFDTFLENYLLKETIEAFVVGYPVTLNNTPSESVKYINPFIRRLRKKYPQIAVHFADERFTSTIALRTMIDGGVKKKQRQDKSLIDKISASLILQSFLDARSNKIK